MEIQQPGDGSDRLFVVEQSGRIKVFANERTTGSAQTFLDITDIVSFSSGQEIGLLGLAFHPQYASNGYFYVYHTRRSQVSGINVELVLARYRVSATNPNKADPASRLDIFSFDKNQNNSNHNGGKIAFGPDGYLYASLGDGGGGDPQRNAQDLSTVFGSILRIDVDVDGNYEIPADNPRRGRNGLDELYAWGLRNTWKFSFDGATGRLWGGDVGQGKFEEINLIERGGNYGWNRFEANSTFSSSTTLVTTPDRKPVYAYNHNNGDVSITLGYVCRGSLNSPAIKNKLIYGDYVSGRIWALTVPTLRSARSPSTRTGCSTSAARDAVQSFTVKNIARWSAEDGWEALGTKKEVGTDNQINALGLAANGTDLFAGGNFVEAGATEATGIARWTDTPPIGIVDGAVYEMEPQYNTTLRLDVRGAATANSTQVLGWRRNGNLNQQWKFISRGNGIYELEPRHAPGKRLDVLGASTATNAPIIIYDRHGRGNQQWRALPVGDGTYRFEPVHAPGKLLDIEEVGGIRVALSRSFDNGNSQRWRLIPVAGAGAVARVAAPASRTVEPVAGVLLYPNPTSGHGGESVAGGGVRGSPGGGRAGGGYPAACNSVGTRPGRGRGCNVSRKCYSCYIVIATLLGLFQGLVTAPVVAVRKIERRSPYVFPAFGKGVDAQLFDVVLP